MAVVESHMKQTKAKSSGWGGVDATDDELMAWGKMGLLLVYLSKQTLPLQTQLEHKFHAKLLGFSLLVIQVTQLRHESNFLVC